MLKLLVDCTRLKAKMGKQMAKMTCTSTSIMKRILVMVKHLMPVMIMVTMLITTTMATLMTVVVEPMRITMTLITSSILPQSGNLSNRIYSEYQDNKKSHSTYILHLYKIIFHFIGNEVSFYVIIGKQLVRYAPPWCLFEQCFFSACEESEHGQNVISNGQCGLWSKIAYR
uniref:Uncharacterized protein n=1 Tax=Aegilops tauschii subsp. strangulata TaxID=200361 RepID=A0A452ZVF5_AEGTS